MWKPLNGAEIYYETVSQVQPLVLIHAGIADCRMWDEQFDSFNQHFRVIRNAMCCEDL